jgi:hypothetical protein
MPLGAGLLAAHGGDCEDWTTMASDQAGVVWTNLVPTGTFPGDGPREGCLQHKGPLIGKTQFSDFVM